MLVGGGIGMRTHGPAADGGGAARSRCSQAVLEGPVVGPEMPAVAWPRSALELPGPSCCTLGSGVLGPRMSNSKRGAEELCLLPVLGRLTTLALRPHGS